MDLNKIDVVDLIIETLREHEKLLDDVSHRLVRSAEIMEQVAKHNLDSEKLNRLEEFVEFRKAEYEKAKGRGAYMNPTQVIGDLDKILEAIRK